MTTERSDSHWIETYRSLVTLSIEGFKFAALANGGAAVALLAYLGNAAGKGSRAPDVSCAMAAFLAGLVACGLALLFAYFTQLKLLNESRDGVRPKFSHDWLLWSAIASFSFSLVSFAFGSYQAVIAFRMA